MLHGQIDPVSHASPDFRPVDFVNSAAAERGSAELKCEKIH